MEENYRMKIACSQVDTILNFYNKELLDLVIPNDVREYIKANKARDYKFDVKPEETLVLEDSANGVQAALAGNLPVINIPDLLPIPKEQQEKCVAVVENLKEVIPYI